MADRDDDTLWTGHDLFDVDGDKIGTIDDVRYGDQAMGLKWLVVKTGLLGTRKIAVPAAEIRREGDRLVAPYDKSFLKDAPEVDLKDAMFEEEERNVCAYYGLDYGVSVTGDVEGCIDENENPDAGGDS